MSREIAHFKYLILLKHKIGLATRRTKHQNMYCKLVNQIHWKTSFQLGNKLIIRTQAHVESPSGKDFGFPRRGSLRKLTRSAFPPKKITPLNDKPPALYHTSLGDSPSTDW